MGCSPFFALKARFQSRGETGCLQTGSHECAARSGPRAFMVRGVRVSGHGGLRDTPGKRQPCLHGRTFAGQRTANSSAVSFLWYRESDRGRNFPYPIRRKRREIS